MAWLLLISYYTVFHKKLVPETSCYNFNKTALISKKRWYKQSTRMTKVTVNVQNVVLWLWRRLWVVSSTGQWPRPQSSVPSQPRPFSSALVAMEAVQLVLSPYQIFQAQWIHNWMAVHCVKIILGEHILIDLCRLALGVRLFMKHDHSWTCMILR